MGNEAGYLGHKGGGQTRHKILAKDISPTNRGDGQKWPMTRMDECGSPTKIKRRHISLNESLILLLLLSLPLGSAVPTEPKLTIA